MAEEVITEGEKYLRPKSTGRKFDHGISWVWDRVKNDPQFPKPIYLGPKMPVFSERELDRWAAEQAAKMKTKQVDVVARHARQLDRIAREVA